MSLFEEAQNRAFSSYRALHNLSMDLPSTMVGDVDMEFRTFDQTPAPIRSGRPSTTGEAVDNHARTRSFSSMAESGTTRVGFRRHSSLDSGYVSNLSWFASSRYQGLEILDSDTIVSGSQQPSAGSAHSSGRFSNEENRINAAYEEETQTHTGSGLPDDDDAWTIGQDLLDLDTSNWGLSWDVNPLTKGT
jgi:hypothetical protein